MNSLFYYLHMKFNLISTILAVHTVVTRNGNNDKYVNFNKSCVWEGKPHTRIDMTNSDLICHQHAICMLVMISRGLDEWGVKLWFINVHLGKVSWGGGPSGQSLLMAIICRTCFDDDKRWSYSQFHWCLFHLHFIVCECQLFKNTFAATIIQSVSIWPACLAIIHFFPIPVEWILIPF